MRRIARNRERAQRMRTNLAGAIERMTDAMQAAAPHGRVATPPPVAPHRRTEHVFANRALANRPCNARRESTTETKDERSPARRPARVLPQPESAVRNSATGVRAPMLPAPRSPSTPSSSVLPGPLAPSSPTPTPTPAPVPCPPTPMPAPVPCPPTPTPAPTPATALTIEQISAYILAEIAATEAAAAAAAEAAAAAAAAAEIAAQQAAHAAAEADERRTRQLTQLAENARAAECVNARTVELASRARAWYQPTLGPESSFVASTLLIVFVLATLAYFWWHATFSTDPWVYVALYAHMFAAAVAAFAFYLVMTATADSYDAQRATIADTAARDFTDFVFGAWALTAPLVKQLYRHDPLIADLPTPSVADENHRLYALQIASNLYFETIDVQVRLQPVQSEGRTHEWRRDLEQSPILREVWANNGRTASSLVTTAFIDQTVFPRPPPLRVFAWPRVSLFARLTRNPLRFILVIVAVATLLFVVLYWWWATNRVVPASDAAREHDSPTLGNTELFVTCVESFYVAAAVIAIAFDNRIASDDLIFNEEHTVTATASATLVASWPFGAPFFKSVYACNPGVQAIELPTDTDPTLVAIFTEAAGTELLQTISTSLKLVDPPAPERVRIWRENFLSHFLRGIWDARRADFVGDKGEFMQRRLVDERGCEPYFVPAEYRRRDCFCRLRLHRRHRRRRDGRDHEDARSTPILEP